MLTATDQGTLELISLSKGLSIQRRHIYIDNDIMYFINDMTPCFNTGRNSFIDEYAVATNEGLTFVGVR